MAIGNDEMYLIYQGFERDINDVFINFTKKLNFEIDYKSDYRFEMHNSISKITILAEVSLSIWIYNSQYSEGILMSQLLYDLDRNLYNQFISIASGNRNKLCFISIANFIFDNRELLLG